MRVIIVGCGRMGSELANQLSLDGHEVIVVDRDPRAFYRLDAGFKGKTVEGIGFDRDILRRAGADQADALAAVTAGDNANIITARVARKVFRIPKIVARLYDPRRAEIYQRLGLQTVSSTSWGVSRAIQLLVNPDLYVTLSLGNGEVELVELEAPTHWISHTVHNVNVAGEINVTAIIRQGKAMIPTSGTVFQAGDRLTIAVLSTARSRLEDMLAL